MNLCKTSNSSTVTWCMLIIITTPISTPLGPTSINFSLLTYIQRTQTKNLEECLEQPFTRAKCDIYEIQLEIHLIKDYALHMMGSSYLAMQSLFQSNKFQIFVFINLKINTYLQKFVIGVKNKDFLGGELSFVPKLYFLLI